MKYKISIIIPIHNVEQYIEECLRSILNQTFDINDIQVIMVDDGSTDNSGKIIDKYAKEYSNFIAVHLPVAHGIAGTARNSGLELAEGDFLMFTDPDDFYDKKACEVMYNHIIKTNSDMVTCNYQNTNIEGEKWESPIFDNKKFKSFKLLESEETYTESFFVLCSSVCVKIFRREFIEKNEIKFLEGVPAEDAYFTYSTLLNSNNVHYLDEVVYYYRQRNQDVETRSISWNCSELYFQRINKAYRKIYELFEKADKLDYYRYLYAKNLPYVLYKFIDSIQISDEHRKNILELMYWFYEKSYKLDVIPTQEELIEVIDKIIAKEYDEVLILCKAIQESRSQVSENTKHSMAKPKGVSYKKV